MSITSLGFGFQGGGSGGGGTPGPQGTPGSVWRSDSGPPADGLGLNGDYYLDNDDGSVYRKNGGTYQFQTVIKGADGTNGTNGSVWYAGDGAPSSSPSFNPNDFYLNNEDGDVFRYDGLNWQPETNIFGTDGTNGSVWYADDGIPVDNPAIYNPNDFYLNNETGEVYQFNGTNWVSQVNIQGANGSQWFTAAGPPVTIQNDGDFYLDSSTGEVYQQVLGGWSDTGTNIKGADGADGTDGSVWYSGSSLPPTIAGYNETDFFLVTTTGGVYQNDGVNWAFQLFLSGVAGSTWYDGDGVPNNSLGNDGDYYLDNLTGDVYTKVSGDWGIPVANITGPQGAAGADGQDGSSSSYFLFKTNAVDISGSPTNQKLRWNNANQLLATELGISSTTDDAIDITIFLSLLNVGDTIIIQDKSDAANYQTFEVSGAITDNTSWFSVPVTFINNGGWSPTGEFPNNHPIFIAISREGTAGLDGANSTRYGFDDTTTSPTAPTSGRFNTNDPDLTQVISISIDVFNNEGIDFTQWLDSIFGWFTVKAEQGNYLQIREVATNNVIGSYLIENIKNFTTNYQFDVVFLAGVGFLDPTKTYSVSYSVAGANGAEGAQGVSAANSNEWRIDTVTPPTNEKFNANPNGVASLTTSFQIADNNVFGNQTTWLNGAKTLRDSGKLGYLSVTPTTLPYGGAIFTINSITDNTTYFTFNVTFYGGNDLDFSVYTSFEFFTFSYIFNGSGGGGGDITIEQNGTVIDPATTTINFTGGGVTASLTSPGIVEVNVPSGGSDGAIVASIRSLSTSTSLSPFTVGAITIPYNGNITGWTIFSDVACTATVTFFSDPFATYPPTTNLLGANSPNLSAEDKNDLTGISIAVTKGQTLLCNLTSILGTVARIDVTLLITKT
jgi:hypothetical protein